MNDGKTEFTIEMKGEGARKQFKYLWDESKKSHRISTSTGRSARIVSRYKHVGTIRNKAQNPFDRAEAKVHSALTTYHQLAHSVFRNPHIATHLRTQLACSLCISRLRFGVGTWLRTTPLPIAKIHHVRMRIGRGVTGKSRYSGAANTPDAAVLEELQRLPTNLSLLRARGPTHKTVQWKRRTVARATQSIERS